MIPILLVEDNPADVMLFREGLRQCEIATDLLIAYDGDQALRVLDKLKEPPTFIILDLNLPKFSGFELLRKFRDSGGPPVAVYTSSDNPKDREEAFSLGAVDYVQKPRGFEATITAVGELLRRLVGRSESATA